MRSQSQTEHFRDVLGNIDQQGNRIWIYPKKPSGKLYTWRSIVSIFLLALLFGGPFLRWKGQPFMLLDIINRNFILFGIHFGPQDFHILLFAMLSLVVFIILFTVTFGRVFCGWICPQTIFMEMLFRKIEYWIEGDAPKKKALDKGPWTNEKIFKKTIKNGLFFIISFLIANTFLSYILGSDALINIITDNPANHIIGLISITVFTFVFFLVFTKVRELACIVICPYGRLQGVLLDKNTIVVAYDFIRGEIRGKLRKGEKREIGDCIDCYQCVQVCPTGIDIRNGTQLECTNCTACIDACDSIMETVGLPKGLIRYDSYNGIANKTKWKLSPRIIAYSTLLVLLISSSVFFLTSRNDLEMTVLRVPGMMYQKLEDGRIGNLYNFELVNKSDKEIPVKLVPESGELELIGNQNLIVPKEGLLKGTFFLKKQKSDIKSMSTEIKISVLSDGKEIEKFNTKFLGPAK